jgi:hypothetical protein
VSAREFVPMPLLDCWQIDTCEELQMLFQGAMQGRFDASEGRRGWWNHVWQASHWQEPNPGTMKFDSPRFSHRGLSLYSEEESGTPEAWNALRRRLDTNSALVLCYIFSLFRTAAPQFDFGTPVRILVNLTDVARATGLPYRTGALIEKSRRVVWDALIYASAARLSGQRKPGRDKDQSVWTQPLKEAFLTIEGDSLSTDPPQEVQLTCAPELLVYLCGALASYLSGGELIRLLPARQTNSAVARAYALHSLTRWRVYRERGMDRIPPVSMQEILREVPPPGEAGLTLPRSAGSARNGVRLLTCHRKALQTLAEIEMIRPHLDADEVTLRQRLKSLRGTLPRALWTRPMPPLLPSARMEEALRAIGRPSRESQT